LWGAPAEEDHQQGRDACHKQDPGQGGWGHGVGGWGGTRSLNRRPPFRQRSRRQVAKPRRHKDLRFDTGASRPLTFRVLCQLARHPNGSPKFWTLGGWWRRGAGSKDACRCRR
jgi:hypothetical protein